MRTRAYTYLLAAGLAAALGTLHCPAAQEMEYANLSKLHQMFPGGNRSTEFDLLKLDDCRVTAVLVNDNIPLIIIQGGNRERAMATAERFVSEFPVKNAQIQPFFKKNGFVAITYPLESALPENHPLRLLYQSGKQPNKDECQFTDWNGSVLTFRVEHKLTSGKKSKSTIDISIDLTDYRLHHAEFRVFKGRMDDDDIKTFICALMDESPYSSSTYSSNAYKAQLRKNFNGADVILYSPSTNFCIVTKRKSYHAGRISEVKDALKSKATTVKPDFPSENISWPSDAGITDTTTEEDTTTTATTPQETPEPQRPTKPSNEGNRIPNTETTRPVEVDLTPAQAVDDYLKLLKNL